MIWLNGEYRAAGAAIDSADRGFLLGDGAFETIYVEGGRPAFLRAHIARLHRGLSELRIAPPLALADLPAIFARLAHDNGLADGAASARITVTRGSSARGLAFPPSGDAAPTMLVTIAPAPAPPADALRLVLSSRRRYSGAATAGFKSIGGYVENILAFNEARAAGGDDALMLNEHGRLTSTARANLFVITGGRVRTPPASEGAMPGVVRAALIAGAGEHGVPIEETPLTLDEAAAAPLFLSNSLLGIVPAQLTPGGGAPAAGGEIVQRLQSWYQQRLMSDLAAEPGVQ